MKYLITLRREQIHPNVGIDVRYEMLIADDPVVLLEELQDTEYTTYILLNSLAIEDTTAQRIDGELKGM